MKPHIFASALALCFLTSASQAATPVDSTIGGTLAVDKNSVARAVLEAVPEEAAVERFEMLNGEGHLVSYVGLAEGPIGGVVFVDSVLQGTLDPATASLFYSCRGYATARHQYWGESASDWANSLIASATPADKVSLVFSGKSTMNSIKAVISNPAIGQVKALVEMGTNPLNIVKVLSSARSNYREREHDEDMQRELSKLAPGDTEKRLADVLHPEDLTFLSNGLVMAYPKYSVEFAVANGHVALIQQPSFLQIARAKPALFYAEGVNWSKCTPNSWREAR